MNQAAATSALQSRIKSEYVEMPGLQLTLEQAQRLWRLDPSVCEAVLGTLVDSKFLTRRPDGRFVRTSNDPGGRFRSGVLS
jgi:hypothetical protein